MGIYYLDTSALVKLYVRESGTERLLALVGGSKETRLAILALAQVELRSAIRRRERNGDIPAALATQVLEAFKRHAESRFVIQRVTDFVLDIASVLVDRYALRALDAVQLAGYAELQRAAGAETATFVCSDQELLAAATQERFVVLNPCS